jgi:hypothetical protein
MLLHSEDQIFDSLSEELSEKLQLEERKNFLY